MTEYDTRMSIWYQDDYPTLHNGTIDDSLPEESKHYLCIYVGLVLALLFTSLLEAVPYSVSSMNAARNLHNSMLSIVLRTPMHFFARNPVGEYSSQVILYRVTLINQKRFFK